MANCRNELALAFKPGNTRMIVLTLKHSLTPLADQVRFLRKSFQELRRRPLWKRNVSGGAAFIEVKIGKDGLWHPHLHILAVGHFLDNRELSRVWYAITCSSSITHVSICPDEAAGIAEVTKYVTKPVTHDVYLHPDRLQEAVIALRGVRVMSTFGTWKKIKLRHKLDPGTTGTWKGLGRLDAIMTQRDDQSRRWREALVRRYPGLDAAYRLSQQLTDQPPPTNLKDLP